MKTLTLTKTEDSSIVATLKMIGPMQEEELRELTRKLFPFYVIDEWRNFGNERTEEHIREIGR